MGLLKQQDWTRSSSGQSPEEDQEAGGDKDSVEKDRIALPEPQLLELGLMKASAKGRIPEMLISVPSIRLSLLELMQRQTKGRYTCSHLR